MEHHLSQGIFDRDGILRALWEDPIVSTPSRELPVRLGAGDEYLDLQDLAAGVQQARRTMAPSGGELSRKAVAPATWTRLLVYLHPAIA